MKLWAFWFAICAKRPRWSLNSSGIGRVERYEYPLEAIRELLVNALMHRDYSPGARGSQVQVELYTNRLVVRSPGGIYGAVTIRDFGQPGVSSTRNSYLASILTDLPDPGTGRLIAENRASGIPTVLRALKDAGLPAPQFADRLLYVQVTLMQPPQDVSSTEQKTTPEDKTQQATHSTGKDSADAVEPTGVDVSLDGLSERQAGIVRVCAHRARLFPRRISKNIGVGALHVPPLRMTCAVLWRRS